MSMSMGVTSRVVVIELVLILVSFVSNRAAACNCIPPPPLTSLDRADAVFHGRLVGLQAKDSPRMGEGGLVEAVFSVREVWKGPIASRMTVVSSLRRVVCQGVNTVVAAAGTEFIVYAFEEPADYDEYQIGASGDLFLHACERTGRFDPLEAAELGEPLWSRAEDGAPFVRGDVNFDGGIDITDPITILPFSFLGASLLCEDAADANDDGVIDVTDVVYLLEFLFLAGESIPPPTEEPEFDPTVDDLGCAGPQV